MTNSYDPNSPYEQLWQQAGQLSAQAPGGYAGYQAPGGYPAPAPPPAQPNDPSSTPAGGGFDITKLLGGAAGAGTSLGLQSLMTGGVHGFQGPSQVQSNFAPALGMAQSAAAGAPSAADALATRGLQQAQQQATARANSTRGNFGMANAAKMGQATGAGLAQQSINENAARKAQEQDAGRQQYGQLVGQENQQEMAARGAQQGQSNMSLGAIAGDIAPAMAMFSDERLKEQAKHVDGGGIAAQFLDHLHPQAFDWKDPHDASSPNAGAGTNLGIHAQDVEKAPLGHTMVTNTPHGKVIDIHALVGALSAGAGAQKQISDHHEARIARLEAAMGKKRA